MVVNKYPKPCLSARYRQDGNLSTDDGKPIIYSKGEFEICLRH